MARRRRRPHKGRLFTVAAVGAVLFWLWSQSWGPTLFSAVAGVLALAAVAWLTTASRRRQRRLRHLATMNCLLSLTPLQFEHEVADLLWSLGFSSIEVTGMAGDLQADIVAVDPEGLPTIVQCKRYAPDRTIGSPVIQSFVGMARIHHDCDRALFVTTGSFTAPAWDLADEHDIELIDGATLVEMFNERAAAFS